MKSLNLLATLCIVVAAYAGAASAAPTLEPPPGAYQNSCTQIEVQKLLGGPGTSLTANCQDQHGTYVNTGLPLPCNGDILNRNGKLFCAKGNNPFAPPAGSYRQSCNSIEQMGPILRAQCRPANGGPRVSTSINTLNCQDSDITVTRRGQLTC